MTELNTSNVHILLVEDNPRYLDTLKKWLKRFGYQHIDSAINAAEAKEKLKQKPWDIVITDMRMEDDDSGFVVFDEVQKCNITAVVIVLTANELIEDCRKAFKLDAWDYISKNMKGNVFEALHDSIQEAITYFNRWGNRKDEMWLKENKASLLAQYHNQYVAVINNKVIESAETEEALRERLREKKLPLFLPVIRKIEEPKSRQPLSIAELIKQGESGTLEFKTTLWWDVRQQQKNKVLPIPVLKTIAAFLNTDGGTLLIGVEDDGNIFGLEQDISLLKPENQSLDGFELALRDLIASNLDAAFSASHLVNIRFEKLDNKDVCVVEVKKSHVEAFMEVKDKHGQKQSAFFIRSGNSTRPLDMKEFYHYINIKREVRAS
jgi:CheY-like chemotaxis protein